MQCRSRNRVTKRRKRNGVGRIGGERYSVWRERGGRVFYGKIDVIVRLALKRVDETPRCICIMIHKWLITAQWGKSPLMSRKLYRGYLCHVLPREPIISASTWVLRSLYPCTYHFFSLNRVGLPYSTCRFTEGAQSRAQIYSEKKRRSVSTQTETQSWDRAEEIQYVGTSYRGFSYTTEIIYFSLLWLYCIS